LKENDVVIGTNFKTYEIKPELLPPIVTYYAESKLGDGRIAKEVMLSMKTFLNTIVFAVKFSFAESLETKIKMLYKTGKSIREIAKDMVMSYTQVRYLLVKSDVTLRKTEMPQDVKEKVKKLAKQGMSAYKIAKELNLNEVTVLMYLRKQNLVKRKKKLTLDEINVIVQMYKEGKSVYEIAKGLGRSTNLIVYHLRKLGLKN